MAPIGRQLQPPGNESSMFSMKSLIFRSNMLKSSRGGCKSKNERSRQKGCRAVFKVVLVVLKNILDHYNKGKVLLKRPSRPPYK